MPYDLKNPLVIGISSRALFDLEAENRIFETQGLKAYEEYQVLHEKDILPKGPAFPLVRAFLELNQLQPERLVEVIIMSRNSPNTSLRPFETDLFLSAYRPDVQDAINSGIAAGMILTGTSPERDPSGQIRIAFDGDAVLFSPDSERIFQTEGLPAFEAHERENADVPMEEGPFANFLMTIAHIQSRFADRESSPIRTALVTSRNAPAHERAIKTLRQWGVRVDEAFFLGGVSKQEVLSAFGAHIFFDDQPAHAEPASKYVPSAVVPYAAGRDPMSE